MKWTKHEAFTIQLVLNPHTNMLSTIREGCLFTQEKHVGKIHSSRPLANSGLESYIHTHSI